MTAKTSIEPVSARRRGAVGGSSAAARLGTTATRTPNSKPKATRWARLTVAVILAGSLAGCAPTELVDASGEEIYQQLCARCHGVQLEGGAAPAIVITADTSDRDLAIVVRDGVGTMAGFGSTLTDEQIGRVVDFLTSSDR